MNKSIDSQIIFATVCSIPYLNAIHLGAKIMRTDSVMGASILFCLLTSVAIFASLAFARNKNIKELS